MTNPQKPASDDEIKAIDVLLQTNFDLERRIQRLEQGSDIGDLRDIRIQPITVDELTRAQLTPRAIVDNYLFADLRNIIAPGGVGKTTMWLFEAVCGALQRPIWGRRVGRPIVSVLVSREDRRPTIVARLREIMNALALSDDERGAVMANVLILDLSGVNFRLSAVCDGVVIPHLVNIDWLIERLLPCRPDRVTFDPLVSFGVGESRVNDAEQGLVDAFRILRNDLNCCIEAIHHSGKINAREKSLDQYSGRNGSALPDGCRMVAVMQPLTPGEWLQATGVGLDDGDHGIVMALPKLSYCPPQEPVYIIRRGYGFRHCQIFTKSPEQAAAEIEAQVLQFITYEFQQGRKYSAADLEQSAEKLNLTRKELRAAITALKVCGKVLYHQKNGRPGSYYEPVSLADPHGEG